MPPSRPPAPAAPLARRAEALLERLRIRTLALVRDLDPRDRPRLRRFMRERERSFDALESLLPAIDRLPARHPLRTSIAASLAALATADQRLAAELDLHQESIAEEILGMREAARPSAYRAAPAVGLALDLTR